MFQTKKYHKEEPKYIYNFIKEHPFATFILNGNRILATHIPILIKGGPENFILYGHIANNNEQKPFLKDGLEALLIFHGAHSYVSSSWYHHENISTWDYSAVHINVRLKIQSKEELIESLKNLVHHFEKGQKNPVLYDDLSDELKEDHLPKITGFWLEPYKIQAIAKLHQGFDKKDIHSVTEHLDNNDNPLSTLVSRDIKNEHGTDH